MKERIATWGRQLVFSVLIALLVLSSVPWAQAIAETGPETNHATHAVAANHETTAVTGEHAAAQSGHGATHSSPVTKEKLKDLFWRALNFVALLFILVKFLGKPIVTALGARQQRIREELADLSAQRDEAERSYRAFETKLAGMEQEMDRVVQQAIGQAESEKERILLEAERTAADIKRQAEAAVQAELEEAKRKLREEVAEQAAAMAEALIAKNLTPADQAAITEQYLERVGAVQ